MNGNERNYDNIHNEGGEGYNPYRAAREEDELNEAIAWGKTRSGRKDRIYRDLERKDCSVAREYGTYSQAEIDDLRAELDAIEAEEDAEFIAAWPLDLTKERRAAWNDRVRRGEFTVRGQVSFKLVADAERAQGWICGNLKKAVKIHKL